MLYVRVFEQICLYFIPLLSEINFCRMCTQFKKCHQDLNKLVADECITTTSMYYVFILNNQCIPNTKSYCRTWVWFTVVSRNLCISKFKMVLSVLWYSKKIDLDKTIWLPMIIYVIVIGSYCINILISISGHRPIFESKDDFLFTMVRVYPR